MGLYNIMWVNARKNHKIMEKRNNNALEIHKKWNYNSRTVERDKEI